MADAPLVHIGWSADPRALRPGSLSPVRLSVVSVFPLGRRDRQGMLGYIIDSSRADCQGSRPTAYGVQASLASPVPETAFGLTTSTRNQ